MTKLSGRQRKVLSKPWITTGLKVSTRMRSKLYASGDEVRYKYCRNKILSLIRISKKYYSDYFEANMSNIKKKKKRGQVLMRYRFAVRRSSTLLLQLRTLSVRINSSKIFHIFLILPMNILRLMGVNA